MILPFSKIIDIIAHRLEGNGIRKTARLCGVDRKTVAHWSLVVGDGCTRLLDRRLRDLAIAQLELDELHTFVGAKERHLRPGAPREHGDCWGYFALCRTSRAIVCHLVGKRTLPSTLRFVAELRARTVGRPHICTDGYGGYLTAIVRSYGQSVDYLQLVKDYEGVTTASGRRVGDAFVSAVRRPMLGDLTRVDASTSHIERFNGTLRHELSRFARRSFQFSKSLLHLDADVAMFTAWYNFGRVHAALETTPAVALGIIDHVWGLDELIETALAEPEPEPLPLPLWATSLTGSTMPADAPPIPPPMPPASESLAAPSPSTVAFTKKAAVAITPREQRVLDMISSAESVTIAEAASRAFPELSEAQSNSWVRNQLRGLLAMGLIEKVGRGTYRAISVGRDAEMAACPTVESGAIVSLS